MFVYKLVSAFSIPNPIRGCHVRSKKYCVGLEPYDTLLSRQEGSIYALRKHVPNIVRKPPPGVILNTSLSQSEIMQIVIYFIKLWTCNINMCSSYIMMSMQRPFDFCTVYTNTLFMVYSNSICYP